MRVERDVNTAAAIFLSFLGVGLMTWLIWFVKELIDDYYMDPTMAFLAFLGFMFAISLIGGGIYGGLYG